MQPHALGAARRGLARLQLAAPRGRGSGWPAVPIHATDRQNMNRPPTRRSQHMARLALLALLTGAAARVSGGAAPRARVAARRSTRAAMVMEDTYWEGEAPPSYVLGNLANAPSGLLGASSGIFLLVGMYCVSASQLGAPLTAATVNPFYIAGSLCVPVSWGLHVAAWIQKKNDM